MEEGKQGHLEQDQVILHRKDIRKYLDKHYDLIQSMKGDVSLIAQTYAQAGKEEYKNIILGYLDCIQVSEEMLVYLGECMAQGIERTKKARAAMLEKPEG